MFFLPFVLLAMHSPAVVAVLANDTVTLALQVGDTVYTAEFSRRDLKPDTLKDGDQVQAEVKHGNLIVKLKNGTKVSARVHWVQRAIIPCILIRIEPAKSCAEDIVYPYRPLSERSRF